VRKIDVSDLSSYSDEQLGQLQHALQSELLAAESRYFSICDAIKYKIHTIESELAVRRVSLDRLSNSKAKRSLKKMLEWAASLGYRSYEEDGEVVQWLIDHI
jgi:hypothetical protein